jgi:ABC-type antimicrobial peptide transport system permease subunit
MAALGADRRQLVALGMAQTLVVGVAGAVGAGMVAFLLSPIAPLGEARLAESATGFAFDAPVLLLGALGTLAVVLVLGLWPALRSAKQPRADDHPIMSGPHPSTTAPAIIPTSLVNFGEAVNFPLIVGVMLALVGAATLAHLLVVSVARRRREIGLLKVLGFLNRQVAEVVAWQATTLALIGIVIGVPVGVLAGQAIWNAFASNLGAVPLAVVPIWLVVTLAVGVLIVANLLAISPALVATRSKPARLLQPVKLNAV